MNSQGRGYAENIIDQYRVAHKQGFVVAELIARIKDLECLKDASNRYMPTFCNRMIVEHEKRIFELREILKKRSHCMNLEYQLLDALKNIMSYVEIYTDGSTKTTGEQAAINAAYRAIKAAQDKQSEFERWMDEQEKDVNNTGVNLNADKWMD